MAASKSTTGSPNGANSSGPNSSPETPIVSGIESPSRQTSPSSMNPHDVILADPLSQMRTTLAIGELIASSRPTAGSRLIAWEIKQFTENYKEESAALRQEISDLGTSLTNSFKNIMEEEREQRSVIRGFMPRRFPIFRRPRQYSIQTARKSAWRSAFGTGPSAPTAASTPASTASSTPAASVSPTASTTNQASQTTPNSRHNSSPESTTGSSSAGLSG